MVKEVLDAEWLQEEIPCFDGIKSKIIRSNSLKDLITYRNPGDGIPHKLSHKVLGKKQSLIFSKIHC